MAKEFRQIDWNAEVAEDCHRLIQIAVREDIGRMHDWTTLALVEDGAQAEAAMVARAGGVIAGLRAAQMVLDEFSQRLEWMPQIDDGARIKAGSEIAVIRGPARPLLSAERLMLNLLGHLSGVATLTRQFVDAVAGTGARIYDTRKTTPGLRLLEKYAVCAGGGFNHRTGLHEAVLIKDNHLAMFGAAGGSPRTAAEAVARIRKFLSKLSPDDPRTDLIVEVEVDTTEQLEAVLAQRPDITLLDNMEVGALRASVAIRDRLAAEVELEASGAIDLNSVRDVAQTGVERISIGALTHSAPSLDVGLDWRTA